MIVTRVSPLTKKVNRMQIPMKAQDFVTAMEAWKNGAYIQDAFPNLNATEREFIKTGYSIEDQEVVFNGEGL